jgi:hypothetical protein
MGIEEFLVEYFYSLFGFFVSVVSENKNVYFVCLINMIVSNKQTVS